MNTFFRFAFTLSVALLVIALLLLVSGRQVETVWLVALDAAFTATIGTLYNVRKWR